MSLQLPALYLTLGLSLAVGLEMVASVIIGWYGGAMFGFVYGAMQILKTTVRIAADMGGKGV